MEILKKVKNYYDSNLEELQTFLENVSFTNSNSKYPNSVVIRFGNNSIIGEISVWELENQKYLEVEYADISKLKSEPVCYTKTVNSETTIEILKNIFKELQKLSKS